MLADRTPVPDLLLLFPSPILPDSRAIHAVIEAIDGLSISTPLGDGEAQLGWELLTSGLTFDLFAGPLELPVVHDWRDVARSTGDAPLLAMGLTPGPHIEAGKSTLPIFRAFMQVARDLVGSFDDLEAVIWGAAGLVSRREHFLQAVGSWLDGGRLPTHVLFSLRDGLDGSVESRGLAYYTGQELRLEPSVTDGSNQAQLLAHRLLEHLLHRGPLTEGESATGLDGSSLRLEPSANQRFIRVWRG